jgi:hypothetical protein
MATLSADASALGIADDDQMHRGHKKHRRNRHQKRHHHHSCGVWRHGEGTRHERVMRGHWRPFELVAMVLGFVVFWPIGLAILAWKKNWFGLGAWFASTDDRRSDTPRSPADVTANTAFAAYRDAELDRLEAERRRLAEEERAFAEFMDRLRRARDQEEFERFLAERRT